MPLHLVVQGLAMAARSRLAAERIITMATGGFTWVVAPEQQLIPNIEAYGKKALVAVQAVATYWGQQVQDAARQGAPWEDRTGNARSGLFFAVDGFGMAPVTGTVTPDVDVDAAVVYGVNYVNRGRKGDITIEEGDDDTLIIVLAHSVFYGKFLELSNAGRYAIVMSTILRNLPDLERMVKEIFE